MANEKRWIVSLCHDSDDVFAPTFFRTTSSGLVAIEEQYVSTAGPLKWVEAVRIYPYKQGLRGGWDGAGQPL